MDRYSACDPDDDGFSLIELLIVVILLGVLASIVVFTVGSTRDDALASSCATRVRSVASSVEAVNTATSAYPAGTVDGTTVPNPFVVPQAGALLEEWPPSTDFILRYDGTGGADYDIDVFRKDGTPVAGCRDL